MKLPKISDIELANISLFRGELMGLAMIFVILFHVALPQSDAFYGLRRVGNIGVDMFLFLSGVGLWFAWTKRPEWRHFFVRRYVRIYPVWLVVSLAYYVPRFSGSSAEAWLDLAGDVFLNWDFWRRDELTFWYVPATMALYTVAPAYMNLIRRHPVYRWAPVVMIIWCVAVQWVCPIHDAVGHIEIFWSRVPIFFIGINLGQSVLEKRRLDGAGIWLVLLTFALGLSTSLYLEQERHAQFPLFIERMLYIPLTVTAILLLNCVLRRLPRPILSLLSWIGGISLECYLLHVQFVLLKLPKGLGYWPTFLLCTLITLPAAWLLAWIMRRVSGAIERRVS